MVFGQIAVYHIFTQEKLTLTTFKNTLRKMPLCVLEKQIFFIFFLQ